MTVADPLPETGGRPGTIVFVLTLVVALAGVVVVVAFGKWRQGSELIGLAMLGAAAGRLLLPDRMAGLLAVRGKTVDVLSVTAIGVGVVALAIAVPSA